MTTSIVVGGSSGLGRAVAQRFADRGDTVIITSRTTAQADTVATEIGGTTCGMAVDLSRPETIAAALVDVREVDNLVISAIAQGVNSLAEFDIAEAIKAVTIKLVGYTETPASTPTTCSSTADSSSPDASGAPFHHVFRVPP